MVGCEALCGNTYLIPSDETYSPACCWWSSCFVPTSPSASCRRAVHRFFWNCVPPLTRRRCLRIMATTTREHTLISRTARLVVHPPPVQLLTLWPLRRRRPLFLSPSSRSNPCTSAYSSHALIS